MDNQIKSEDSAPYPSEADAVRNAEDFVLRQARFIIIDRFKTMGDAMSSPAQTREYARLMLAGCEHEVFAMMVLNNRNEVIQWREMFRGTVDGASVYPREVVKQVLADNGAAVIFVHNHPSGVTDPSAADVGITERLKSALALIDVRVLDHLIVGKDVTCFSEKGLL